MIRALYYEADGTAVHIVIDIMMVVLYAFYMFVSLLEEDLLSLIVHLMMCIGLLWFSRKLLIEDYKAGKNNGNDLANCIIGILNVIQKYKIIIQVTLWAGLICCLGVFFLNNGTEVKEQPSKPSYYDIHKYENNTNTNNRTNTRNNSSDSAYSCDPDDYDDYGYYDDFEDFYNDHYDDFDSYEEAEDYYDAYY